MRNWCPSSPIRHTPAVLKDTFNKMPPPLVCPDLQVGPCFEHLAILNVKLILCFFLKLFLVYQIVEAMEVN